MVLTLTTSGAIQKKAGKDANDTIAKSGAALQKFGEQAEGQVEALTRRKWRDNYADLDQGIKDALDDATSDIAALKVITWDLSGYVSSRAAETSLDVIRDNADRLLTQLRDFKSNSLQKPE